MKNIIEKEIERREVLIAEKAEKENKVIELQIEIERLTQEITNTDETVLLAEIDELKGYLPKPVEEAPVEEPAYDDSVNPELTVLI